MTFKGDVVLITGGASGMGRVAAHLCSDWGKKVAIFDIDVDGLKKTADGHDNIHHWQVDVTNTEAVKQAVIEVEEQLGPVDRLYHAAAIMPFGKILEFSPEATRRMMDINYMGLVNITHAVLPRMVERGRGDFISFASMAGWIPTLLTGAYSASKFAVACYTETLYHENRDSGVRFACVCPPGVNTPLLEQGKATAWPKMMDDAEVITPQQVIDTIESALEKKSFWVFPNSAAKWGVRVRRWFPEQIWKKVHQVEGW